MKYYKLIITSVVVLFTAIGWLASCNQSDKPQPMSFAKTTQSTTKPVRDSIKIIDPETGVVKVVTVKDTYKVNVTVSYDSVVFITSYVPGVPVPPTDTVTIPPPPTGYTLTYENNFNSSKDLDPDGHGQIGNGTLSTTTYVSAPASFKSSPASVSAGYRSEVQFNGNRTYTEGGVSFKVLFENYKPYGWGGSCFQMHGNNDNSANLFMYCSEGKFNVYRNPNGGSNLTQPGTLKTIVSNTWYDHRYEWKWSTGNDGYFKVYIDGVLYYSFTGRTQDGNGIPYIKIGQNNWGSSKGTTMYFDDVKIWKK